MVIKENISLINFNTLRLNSECKYFIELNSVNELYEIHNFIISHNLKYIIIGQGSNIILPEFFNGLVIYNNLLGKKLISKKHDVVILSAMAGENFNDFITYCLNNDYFGLENLSLIPGTVGASPVQNIGAYGSEVKDYIDTVIVYDLKTNNIIKIFNSQCKFSYRNSIFKSMKNYLIIEVIFKLNLTYKLNVSYSELAKHIHNINSWTPYMLRELIVNIRKSKLPDYKILHNVGSFFHNPQITIDELNKLKKKFYNIPNYQISSIIYKVPAGWLIDNIGLKGYRIGNVGVYEKQALVLINYSTSTQAIILDLANYIQKKVLFSYNIKLKIEPEVIY